MVRTLSKNEARIILDLEWRGQRTVTLEDIRRMLRATETNARYVAHRLVRKGWLERLRPGLYQLVPADRGQEGVADSNPLTAGAVLVKPYFFSFGTACTYYGLTEQVFADAMPKTRAISGLPSSFSGMRGGDNSAICTSCGFRSRLR